MTMTPWHHDTIWCTLCTKITHWKLYFSIDYHSLPFMPFTVNGPPVDSNRVISGTLLKSFKKSAKTHFPFFRELREGWYLPPSRQGALWERPSPPQMNPGFLAPWSPLSPHGPPDEHWAHQRGSPRLLWFYSNVLYYYSFIEIIRKHDRGWKSRDG